MRVSQNSQIRQICISGTLFLFYETKILKLAENIHLFLLSRRYIAKIPHISTGFLPASFLSMQVGASGDIGFIPKASNINGLRAIEQQYLRQNQITVLDFEGVSAMERPFILPKSKARKRNQRPVVKKGAQMTFFTLK